jgi:hypothetical protein
MAGTTKVFISYSWTNPAHEDWVINLAERLVSDGVDVVIDKWDLKEGQDKYDFMETMVKSEEISKVLIILDKKYAEKAEQRSGGVGTETQIISPSVYANVSQEKFIPIIAERDEAGKAYLPTYLESRIYIDLSSQDTYEENYEKLLRNIYKRPAYNKPQLGKAPSYLFEETPMTHKTSSILRGFENQINKNPKKINSILREFLDEFFSNFKEYSVVFTGRDYITIGKDIHDKLNLYLPLRNDFIYFFDKLTREDLEFEIDIVIRFLEKLSLLKRPLDDRSSWSQTEFEVFRFATHELFLYLIAIGLKNGNYKFVEELLYSHYFFQDKYEHKKEPETFGGFYNYVDAFDEYYKQTFSKDFFSPMADFIIKRIPDGFTKDNIVEADLLCHYVASLNNIRWFPITYVYKTEGSFELFKRITSARHFEKVKGLFGVTNANELKEKLIALEQTNKDVREIRYSNSFDYVFPLYRMINANTIATTR